MISTSVSKDYIEPSVASLVHGNLELADHCINYDLGNACLGFVNAMASMGMMIDAGLVDYGLIVDGENSREVVEATIQPTAATGCQAGRFQGPVRHPHFRLRGGGHDPMPQTSVHIRPRGQRVGDPRGHPPQPFLSGTAGPDDRRCLQGADLRRGTGQENLGPGQQQPDHWSDAQINAYMPHQVSRRNMDVLNDKLGLTPEKHHLNFPTLGNIGPAAVPITLCQAAESGRIRAGDHVALMGIGSGLNCSMMSVTW